MTTLLTDPEARACFVRIEKRFRAAGTWEPQFALGLASAAAQCAAYLADARRFRIAPPEIARLLAAQLKISHRLARRGLRLFVELPAGATMNAQGEDAVIATLCAPLPQRVRTNSVTLAARPGA